MHPFDKWILIKPLVLLGRNDYQIARETGINRGTVQRLRSVYMGNDDVRPLYRSPHDWAAIQSAYDAGMSWRELGESFGISQRSISLARNRGDILTGRSISDAMRIAVARGRIKPHRQTVEQRRAISVRQSSRNSGGRSKWFEVRGIKLQGTWERDLAIKMDEWGLRWERVNGRKSAWPYMLDGKEKHYTPDFYLPDHRLWIEVKGHWWGDDRRKMKAVMKRYPRRKIVIIGKSEFKVVVGSSTAPAILGPSRRLH